MICVDFQVVSSIEGEQLGQTLAVPQNVKTNKAHDDIREVTRTVIKSWQKHLLNLIFKLLAGKFETF